MILETPRLVLRPLTEDDGEALHAAFSDEETLEHWHMAVTASVEESRERTKNHTGPGMFAIQERGAEDAIGFVGFAGAAPQRDRQTAFGYLLRKDHWGKGYALEAAKAVLDFGFARLSTPAAELWIYEGNDRSRRVAEKLGATYRGINVGFNLLRGPRKTHVYEIRAPGVTLPPDVLRVIPVLRVGNLNEAADWYAERLGFAVEWSTPTLASLMSAGWVPLVATVRIEVGEPRPARLVFQVAERIDEIADRAGASAEDHPWGLRDFTVTDPWGNALVFETTIAR